MFSFFLSALCCGCVFAYTFDNVCDCTISVVESGPTYGVGEYYNCCGQSAYPAETTDPLGPWDGQAVTYKGFDHGGSPLIYDYQIECAQPCWIQSVTVEDTSFWNWGPSNDPVDDDLTLYTNDKSSIIGTKNVGAHNSNAFVSQTLDLSANEFYATSFRLAEISSPPDWSYRSLLSMVMVSQPTADPTLFPTSTPTSEPTTEPTANPSRPSYYPTAAPSALPTNDPTSQPTTKQPTAAPSNIPSSDPTTSRPTAPPTNEASTTTHESISEPVQDSDATTTTTWIPVGTKALGDTKSSSTFTLTPRAIVIAVLCTAAIFVAVFCICATVIYTWKKRREDAEDESEQAREDPANIDHGELPQPPAQSIVRSSSDRSVAQHHEHQVDDEIKMVAQPGAVAVGPVLSVANKKQPKARAAAEQQDDDSDSEQLYGGGAPTSMAAMQLHGSLVNTEHLKVTVEGDNDDEEKSDDEIVIVLKQQGNTAGARRDSLANIQLVNVNEEQLKVTAEGDQDEEEESDNELEEPIVLKQQKQTVLRGPSIDLV